MLINKSSPLLYSLKYNVPFVVVQNTGILYVKLCRAIKGTTCLRRRQSQFEGYFTLMQHKIITVVSEMKVTLHRNALNTTLNGELASKCTMIHIR